MSESTTATALAPSKPEIIPITIPNVPSMAEIEALKEIGKAAAYSNFLNSNAPLTNEWMTVRAADAFFVIMLGRELGIAPMTSLKNIYVIDGKPACNGQMMLALMRKGGVEVKIPDPSTVTDSATVRIKRPDTGEWADYTYTKDMAVKAGLWTGKKNWEKYPAMMLIWRAVAMGSRFEAPDITGGLHTVEELAPDTPVDEEGTPVGDIIIGKVIPPKNGSGSSKSKDSINPDNVIDFSKPGATESWLEAKDEKGETGEQRLLAWIYKHYQMTSEEALKLLKKTTWADYPDGKAACNAVKAAIENAEPATPKNAASDSNGAGGWTDEDDLILSEAIWNSFNKLTADVLQALDKPNFREYPSRAKAWNAVRGLALAQSWPVVMEKATYNGSYVTLKGPFDIRVYGRSSKFKEMVGETYYDANNIEDWEKGDTLYEIEPLLITWERKGDKQPYLLATAAKPLFDETENVPETADPELDELLEFFGGQS